jgi:hypothetical protein
MRWSVAVVCVLLGVPNLTVAQAPAQAKPPETLLPAGSVAYVRFDGIAPHRRAYEQTALAKVMSEDLGDFCRYLAAFTLENAFDRAGGDRALAAVPGKERTNGFCDCGGAPVLHNGAGDLATQPPQPDGRARAARSAKVRAQLDKVADYLGRKGFAAAFEVIGSVERERLTIVFPGAGAKEDRDSLFELFRALAAWQGVKVKTVQRGRRTLQQIPVNDAAATWWQEGEHVVFTLGSEPVDRSLDVIDGKRPNLAGTALFKSVAAFKRYETFLRGYVDLAAIVELLHQPAQTGNKLEMLKEAATRRLVLAQLGLGGLKSLTFHCGFDRQFQRRTAVVQVAEPTERKGLLRLVSAPVDFPPDQLPPLPPDAASVSVRHVDWVTVHDVLQQTGKMLALRKVLREGDPLTRALSDPAAALGFDVRAELLAALDPTTVFYHAHSEGPFFLGYAMAIRVKDAGKVQKSMDRLAALLRQLLRDNPGLRWGLDGREAGFQRHVYRGAELHTLSAALLAPTFTVHKGWLVIGFYPQAVKAYVLRAEGKLAVWKAPALVKETLAAAGSGSKDKSRLAAVTVTDPRPTLERVLALAPAVVRALGSFGGPGDGQEFDVTKLPSAQSVTAPLFPNVTAFFDDGDALRWESHVSLDVPLRWVVLLWLADELWHGRGPLRF